MIVDINIKGCERICQPFWKSYPHLQMSTVKAQIRFGATGQRVINIVP
jgi:hypothetical protein